MGDLGILNDDNAPQAPTLNEYSIVWIKDEIEGEVADSSQERYESVLKRDILPQFGKMHLDEITGKEISSFFKKLKKSDRTSKSIALTRTVFRACLADAVIEGYIAKNPFDTVRRRGRTDSTPQSEEDLLPNFEPFTPDEISQFLAAASADSPDVYGPMFLCAFSTGMRLGEFIALRWEDIDWTDKTVCVRRSFKRGKISLTKTKAIRHVDLSDKVLDALRDLRDQRTVTTIKNVKQMPAGYIFHYRGNCRAQNTVRKAFNKYLADAELRHIRVHDTRHTYASILISYGVDIYYISKQLGHKSIKTTADIYAHLLKGSKREAVNLLGNLIELKTN